MTAEFDTIWALLPTDKPFFFRLNPSPRGRQNKFESTPLKAYSFLLRVTELGSGVGASSVSSPHKSILRYATVTGEA